MEQNLPLKRKKKCKNFEKPVYTNMNAFKEQQKQYKYYKNHQTDFSQVYNTQNEKYLQIQGYKVFPLIRQGAFLVKQFNSLKVVNNLAMLALNEYCQKPYRTNLNLREDLYAMKQEHNENMKINQLKEESLQEKVNYDENQKNKTVEVQIQSDQKIQTENQNLQKDFIQKKKLSNLVQKKEQKGFQQRSYYFNNQIRWANVGYQYDWTSRQYPQYQTKMHPSLSQLCQRANSLYQNILNDKFGYCPESIIINYYSDRDYMTGHLDDAQIDQQSPIYSFSFGLSCIFLMGGPSKQDKPIAIKLDSGDLFIMSQSSRKCYHGVPRILKDTYNQPKPIVIHHNLLNNQINAHNYLLNHRININARQVYPK